MKMNQSILLRIVLVVSAVTGLLFLASGIFEYQMTRTSGINLLEKDATLKLERIQYSLVTPIWDINNAEAGRLIALEMKEDSIAGITVLNEEGKTFVSKSKAKDGQLLDTVFNNSENLQVMSGEIKREGKVIGKVDLYITDAAIKTQLKNNAILQVVKFFAQMLVATAVLYLLIRSVVIRPITAVTRRINDIARGEGDLTKRLEIQSHDEIGELSSGFNEFVEKIQDIVKKIASTTSSLSSSSSGLNSASIQIADNSKTMAELSTTVASSTEEASAGIASISRSAEDMSKGIAGVSSSITDLSNTLTEVARNCSKESQIAADANTQAQQMQQLMDHLNSSATEIGKVVGIINGIASQTNLLALNATIEAASAGAAGKGFAVVASEVKELARQTARATEGISKQVDGIQQNTLTAVASIQRITLIIGEINTISQSINSSIEQQSAAVVGIARTMGDSNHAASQIAHSVEESAIGLTDVSRSIQSVNQAAQETTNGIGMIKHSAEQLATLSIELKTIVQQFKV